MLLERNYKSSTIDAALRRARAIPRAKALQRVANPNHTMRPVYAVPWDPRLPNLQSLQSKHWRSMTISSPYLREVYPGPPMIAYRRQKNTRDLIIRAKVPQPSTNRPNRRIVGMKKCQKCIICPFIKEGNIVQGPNFTWTVNEEVKCSSRNIVYMIACNLETCKDKYIGESERTLKDRISEHVGYIRTKKTHLVPGEHFDKPGHSLHHAE